LSTLTCERGLTATHLSIRQMCERTAMSMRMLRSVEAAAEIDYGVRQAGRFREETIAKLVSVFERQGVSFLPPNRPRAGHSLPTARLSAERKGPLLAGRQSRLEARVG
jgi:hypothetical protein